VTTPSEGVEYLAAEVRYHRERIDLYKAKMYGLRAVDQGRLRELERNLLSAELRLQQAREAAARDSAGRPSDPGM
jgi:hypothetical protein